MKPACVTDYNALYAFDYFAHAADSASFNTQAVPAIIARKAEAFGRAVLDIGGGSGLLSSLLAPLGVTGFTVDAAVREGERFQTLNLAVHDPEGIAKTRERIVEALGSAWFATCFDVAEHIDREHLADFLLNLSALMPEQGAISISTRPSSSGNRFHSTVIPIDTWKHLFSLAGFEATPDEDLDGFANNHFFSGSTEALVAVSHWQRVNPFRDRVAHQHYLRLVRSAKAMAPAALRERVARLLDLDFRAAKRASAQVLDLPPLTFNVHFMQDWSFARSLMDVWPADRFRLLLRRDTVAAPYRHLIANYCRRVGVDHHVIADVEEGQAALSRWGVGEGHLVATATEGVLGPLHLMNSLLMDGAAQRGATTVCLQHGAAISRGFRPVCDVVGAWDEGSWATLAALVHNGPSRVACLGSTKFNDALFAPSSAGLSARLGDWTVRFSRTIMIGLNLHWPVHENGVDDTLDWLLRLADNAPDTLFILRPHPDDSSVYGKAALFQAANIVVLDDMALLAMDVSVARLMTDVDALIATTSTLHLDARAAGKPSTLLPAAPALGGQARGLLDASWPAPGPPASLGADDWRAGRLPEARAEAHDESWFAPSREAIGRLAACVARPVADRASLRQCLGGDLMAAMAAVDYDAHPHADRTRLEAAVAAFCGE